MGRTGRGACGHAAVAAKQSRRRPFESLRVDLSSVEGRRISVSSRRGGVPNAAPALGCRRWGPGASAKKTGGTGNSSGLQAV